MRSSRSVWVASDGFRNIFLTLFAPPELDLALHGLPGLALALQGFPGFDLALRVWFGSPLVSWDRFTVLGPRFGIAGA